jgi:hypothetical protein
MGILTLHASTPGLHGPLKGETEAIGIFWVTRYEKNSKKATHATEATLMRYEKNSKKATHATQPAYMPIAARSSPYTPLHQSYTFPHY